MRFIIDALFLATYLILGIPVLLVLNLMGKVEKWKYKSDLAADILTDIAGEQRAKVVYQNLYRQIKDKGVRETIDFLLNREEAHGTMLREAFNRIQDTGSQKDWGTTADARIYFDLSHPGGQSFDPARKNPSKFPN